MTPDSVSALVSAGRYLSALFKDGGKVSVLVGTDMRTLHFSDVGHEVQDRAETIGNISASVFHLHSFTDHPSSKPQKAILSSMSLALDFPIIIGSLCQSVELFFGPVGE